MPARRRLPFRITLLLALVLTITVFSAVRLYTGIAWSRTLETYMPTLLVAYVAITGAIWMLLGCFVLWSFWRRIRYSRWIFLAAAFVYALWAWADRLLIQPGSHANWQFALIGTLVLLAYTAVVVLDPHLRVYFRKENHERQS